MMKKKAIDLDIMVIIALFTIYFLSGLCALIDEVIWVRLIRLSLGNTVYASSIVVSVFMGGLALGALIMARYSSRIKKPLKTYAILEVCATFLALSVPFLLKLAEPGYALLFKIGRAHV
jgi:spermidine synthase